MLLLMNRLLTMLGVSVESRLHQEREIEGDREGKEEREIRRKGEGKKKGDSFNCMHIH